MKAQAKTRFIGRFIEQTLPHLIAVKNERCVAIFWWAYDSPLLGHWCEKYIEQGCTYRPAPWSGTDFFSGTLWEKDTAP
jgi:hypothetical protein